MAAKGLLALTGLRPPDEDEGGGAEDEASDGDSPKARAMSEMFEAMQAGDFEGAGHAFERAYLICKQGKGSGDTAPKREEPSEEAYEDEG